MSNMLRTSSIVTASLFAASISGYLFSDYGGTLLDLGGAIYLVIWLLVLCATLLSCFITLAIWIAQKNRESNHDQSLYL